MGGSTFRVELVMRKRMVARCPICEDPAMRHVWVLALLTATLSFAAGCARPAPEAPTGNRLVLEVGGEQTSLREALREMGRPVGAPKRLRPAPPAPLTSARRELFDAAPPRQPVDGADDQGGAQVAAAPAQPLAPAEQEWVIVKMKQGDANLGDVAKRHLGSSRRYLDIQRWNDIDDEQAKRLRVGHELKLKRSELK